MVHDDGTSCKGLGLPKTASLSCVVLQQVGTVSSPAFHTRKCKNINLVYSGHALSYTSTKLS